MSYTGSHSETVSAHGAPPVSDEDTSLLPQLHLPKLRVVPEEYVHRVLPLALCASLAMAATAATTAFAYAVIICSDPAHCRSEDEQRAYSSAVAVATGIANLCGTLLLAPLQAAVKWNPKAGMFAWIAARSASVCVLCIAVLYKSMPLAFVGRIFEGFATDNLLHYNLNAIFVASVPDEKRFSRLVGTSLALYLAGMALSPTLAALLPTFFMSFFLALVLFAVAALYLAVFIPTVWKTHTPGANMSAKTKLGSFLSLHRPLVNLIGDRDIILPGVALLLYNTTLAYIFPALMVYTTLEFAFTSRQNGFLISIAAGVSAFSLFLAFYVFPWVKKVTSTKDQIPGTTASSVKQNLVFAMSSMFLQLIALTAMPFTANGWQVLPLVALLAFGIAAPGFLKNYGVALAVDKPAAVASLAMMEILGGLLSVLVLGAWQSWLGHTSVFWAAAGLVAVALLAITSSLFSRACTTYTRL